MFAKEEGQNASPRLVFLVDHEELGQGDNMRPVAPIAHHVSSLGNFLVDVINRGGRRVWMRKLCATRLSFFGYTILIGYECNSFVFNTKKFG